MAIVARCISFRKFRRNAIYYPGARDAKTIPPFANRVRTIFDRRDVFDGFIGSVDFAILDELFADVRTIIVCK